MYTGAALVRRPRIFIRTAFLDRKPRTELSLRDF